MLDKRSIANNLIASFIWAISVAGGALLAAKFLEIEILKTLIPLWAFVFVSILLVLVLIFLIINLFKRKRLVFIVMPAFSHKHWFAQVLQNLLVELHTKGYDAIVKIPSNEFSPQAQSAQLRSISQQRGQFAAGFVIAVESDNTRDELVQFCQQIISPVVFMDVKPFNNSSDYPLNSTFVGFPASNIGKIAANFVASYINQHKIENPFVLVLGGSFQLDRQREFEKVLKEKLPQVELRINEAGEFQRERAKEIISLALDQMRQSRRQIHCIFCTNDEMALGAVDAIQSSNIQLAKKICIVGVDGTDEAISVIRTRKTPFQATIIQESRRVAEIAVELFLKKQSGERVEPENLLTPQIYPRNSI